MPFDDGGEIPLGQSRFRDGREVFWWEQFPRYVKVKPTIWACKTLTLCHRLHGFYRGRNRVVPLSEYTPEQSSLTPFDPDTPTTPTFNPLPARLLYDVKKCYLDDDEQIPVPMWGAYDGQPRGMSAPLFGSHQELGLDLGFCYDRISRLGVYGPEGSSVGGDDINEHPQATVDWSKVEWASAQEKCYEKNKSIYPARTAVAIRTWHTYKYTTYDVVTLRAIISELALQTGGEYTVHFLIHVQDDTIPIWASEEEYNRVMEESLPEEFQGMGTLWSVGQMKMIYPGPFQKSLVNFSGGNLYEAYRSLHFPLQYFASKHPEYDYFWQWEMDIRVTGHYYELFGQLTEWAEAQPRAFAWERSSKYFIPSLYNNSYDNFAEAVKQEVLASGHAPIIGPQGNKTELLKVPHQDSKSDSGEIVDLITLNPLFNPKGTGWAFRDDITGYVNSSYVKSRPPTRAALVTASRMSRRLLLLMHEEAYRNKHTMFPEMFPASIAFHYGLKAVSAPLPIYFDRDWPAVHANEIFNNAPVSEASKAQSLKDRKGYFHGPGGSVFGPAEHVFRGSTYYSNAAFASYLWRRWLGHEHRNDEIAWESEGAGGGGRMCLPMMVLHTVKED